MAPSALKKRKISPLSRSDGNKTYAPDAAGHVSSDSFNEEGEIVPGNRSIPSSQSTLEAKRNSTLSWSSATDGASMFKLKANELLAKVRPDYQRHMVKVESSLRKLKHLIEHIPDRDAKPVCKIAFVPIQPDKLPDFFSHRFSKRSTNTFTLTKSEFHSHNPGPQRTRSTRWPTPSQRTSMS